MVDGVEVGRVNVAARGYGVALRAFELAIAYAQRRHAFGQPFAQHQAIEFKLAEMATKVEAARPMVMAARRKDSGRQNDLAGMAKYLVSEYRKEVWRAPSASTAATASPGSSRSSAYTGRRRCH